MASFTPIECSTSSMLRAGLLACLLIGIGQVSALDAAPVIFQATTLDSDGCGATLSGDNFSFSGYYEHYPSGCGGRSDVKVGIPAWPLPGQPSDLPVALGTVNLPGVSDRVAVIYGGGQPSLYKYVVPDYLPEFFSGEVAVNVVLSGTLQVCLEPAYVMTPGEVVSCDPQYANFGLVNINVAGQAIYFASDGTIGVRTFQGFTGTAAAAPEPSHLGVAAGLALLLIVIVSQVRRHYHIAGTEVKARMIQDWPHVRLQG